MSGRTGDANAVCIPKTAYRLGGSATIFITSRNSREIEVGTVLPCDAELAETEEMLSSSSGGHAFISANLMKGGGVGHLRVAVSRPSVTVTEQVHVKAAKSDPITAAVFTTENAQYSLQDGSCGNAA